MGTVKTELLYTDLHCQGGTPNGHRWTQGTNTGGQQARPGLDIHTRMVCKTHILCRANHINLYIPVPSSLDQSINVQRGQAHFCVQYSCMIVCFQFLVLSPKQTRQLRSAKRLLFPCF